MSYTKIEAKYLAEIKSFKFLIKSLKREVILIQKASSFDKFKILFLKAKVVELKDKLEKSI